MTSRHCFIALPLMLISAAAYGGVQEFTDKDGARWHGIGAWISTPPGFS